MFSGVHNDKIIVFFNLVFLWPPQQNWIWILSFNSSERVNIGRTAYFFVAVATSYSTVQLHLALDFFNDLLFQCQNVSLFQIIEIARLVDFLRRSKCVFRFNSKLFVIYLLFILNNYSFLGFPHIRFYKLRFVWFDRSDSFNLRRRVNDLLGEARWFLVDYC